MDRFPDHVIGCDIRRGKTCNCAEIKRDAERKWVEYTRNTPLQPIDGNRFKA